MRDIGVAVFLLRDDKILIGKRGPASKNGAGLWALPGGLVEDHETVAEGAMREIEEETGLTVSFGFHGTNDEGLLSVTDHDFRGKKRITCWLGTTCVIGDVMNKEPTKCEEWLWMDKEQLRAIPGVYDPTSRQWFWVPMDHWDRWFQSVFIW